MKWYDNLYVSESIKDAGKIKWRIMHNAGTIDIYVITFASNSQNLLDIIPSWNLMQKSYPKKELKVIGLAKGYGEALELTRQIIEETYDETGNVNIRDYLKESRRTVS